MRRKLLLFGGAGLLILACSMVISLSMGTAPLPVVQVWRVLLHELPFLGGLIDADWPQASEQIIWKVRFPRVALALLVGAALSIAGTGFQGVLRNPLADPYTLGVASGAAVGAAAVILFGLQLAWLGPWTIPAAAFITALISLWLVFRLAAIQGKLQLETLILSGVVVQAFLGAIVSYLVSLSRQTVNEVIFWMMGSLAMKGWSYTLVLLPYAAAGLLILLRYGRDLNLLALGERQAAYAGVNVERTKLIVLLVSTLVTAGAVSVSGTIGFVGLIIPHFVRLIIGPDYRLILPLSALFGGIYLLWADTLARMLLSPTDIPLGVITAFLGAPFFAYLLYQRKKRLAA
ncbi:FecCD family ABC transporter permease [Paenibacillus sp. y28]|uniref:FecCD family ABC transporter permease n=1 Tax=Paenibacillus sp. y28 TaxID=3129110 RepID=UPI003018E12C